MTTKSSVTQLIVMLTTMPVVTPMVTMPPVFFLAIILHVVTILLFTCICGRCPQRRRTNEQNASYQK
jgi:hypothetical protein